MTEQAFTILRADELEQSGDWLLARRSLGLSAFGMNLVDIQPGEQIPEHDETGRDQEEVFVVLERRGHDRDRRRPSTTWRRAPSPGSTPISRAPSSTAVRGRCVC